MIFETKARRSARVLMLIEHTVSCSAVEISAITGISPGRVYPILARLEIAGQIEGFWVPGPYPRKRRYRSPNLLVSEYRL